MLFCQYKRKANSSLKEEIRPDRKNVVFTYDALGRRIQKAYNKKITRWVWDGNTPLHEWIEASEEENKQPEEVITWVFDEGRFCPAARLVGDKAYSIITDYLGTPVQAYNESGKLKWETELDIYGKVRTFEGDKALIPFRYQGQYEDEETGLYYNRFRYYSPDEGIYLSQDPIGLSGGNPTLYGYVHDPNGWVDSFGLDCRSVTPRNANNLVGGPLEHATQVSGRFPLERGPSNGTLFRADNQGNVTSYAAYDNSGMITKRVDVTGAAHRGASTPHVIEYGRNTYTNSQGQTITRVQSPNTQLPPRAARGDEIP